jgi:hypothetical protein
MKISEAKGLPLNACVVYKKCPMYFNGLKKGPVGNKLLMRLARVPGGRTTATVSLSAVKRQAEGTTSVFYSDGTVATIT